MNNSLINTPNGTVYAPGLKRRGHNQHKRVHNGVQNGSLTATEMDTLKGMRDEARANLTEAKGNNGWVGPRERMALHGDLNQLSQTIFQLKHN